MTKVNTKEVKNRSVSVEPKSSIKSSNSQNSKKSNGSNKEIK